jgi:glycogen synthase
VETEHNKCTQEKRMKILHTIYDHMNNPWVGGGGAVRVYELYKRLAGRGHEVTVLSGNYPGANDYSEDGVTFRFIGNDRNYIFSTFSYACEAVRFVRTYGNEFGIIVEDFAPWNPLFSRFLTKQPVILHINHKEGGNIFKRRLLPGIPFFLLEAFYPRLFSNITVLSEATKKKIKKPEATVVPVGIDGGLFSGSRTEYRGNNDGNYILYIGRLHIKNKGLDTLLYAMKDVDSKLLMIGKGADETKLKKLVDDLALNNVEFLGFVSDKEKIDLLRRARLFVLPSRFEGWGIVVLEASACGIPVIVSDIPELEYAVNGGFGISFRTGNAGDLSAKIKLLLANESMRIEMGRRAGEFARNYTWDKIAEEYEKFLMKITQSQRGDPHLHA